MTAEHDYHWGPDPGHGGLTQHHGDRESCPGPDCGPDPDGPITPADIQQVTRYATETRPPAVEIPAETLQTLANRLHDWLCGWNCQGHGILQERQEAKYRKFAETAVEVLGPLLIQAGREQAARDILARAAAREAILGDLIDPEHELILGWLRQAAYIARHGTRLTGPPPADDPRTYQDGRNDAANALLACLICEQIHSRRDIGDGERTYAAPDGHPYHPAALEASTAEDLAAIARGTQSAGDTQDGDDRG